MAKGKIVLERSTSTGNVGHGDYVEPDTPGIDWSRKFRLEVIWRIMRRVIELREESQEPVDRIPAYQWVTEIYYISHECGRYLTYKRARIEAALGCTLEKVREEMAP